jgi:hypothetical protein
MSEWGVASPFVGGSISFSTPRWSTWLLEEPAVRRATPSLVSILLAYEFVVLSCASLSRIGVLRNGAVVTHHMDLY